MVKIMREVHEEFSTLLKKRLTEIHTNEASVRFTFLAALLKQTNITSPEVILDCPHPKIRKAKVDTYITSTKERGELIFEFKYDREIPSGKETKGPKRAGKLFNDIYRLTQFDAKPNATRWLIYLTDAEMANYLRNPDNGLVDFFELPVGEVLRIDKNYIASKSATFQGAIVGSISVVDIGCIWKSVDIKCIRNEKMPIQHELRIYEIPPHSVA